MKTGVWPAPLLGQIVFQAAALAWCPWSAVVGRYLSRGCQKTKDIGVLMMLVGPVIRVIRAIKINIVGQIATLHKGQCWLFFKKVPSYTLNVQSKKKYL